MTLLSLHLDAATQMASRAHSHQLFGVFDNATFLQAETLRHLAEHADYFCRFTEIPFEHVPALISAAE